MMKDVCLIFTQNAINFEKMKFDSINGYKTIHNENLFLVGENWESNIISLFCSTLPSHHKIFFVEDELSFNNYSFHENLIQENIGINLYMPKSFIPICKKVIPSHILNVLKNDNDIFLDLIDIIDKLNKPIIIIIQIKNSIVTDIKKEKRNHRSLKLIDMKTEMVILLPNEKTAKKKLEIINQINSIVDISPTLLNYLDIQPHVAMIGKDFSPIWRNPKKKVTNNLRKSVIFEHSNGSKTIITDKYKITIFLNDSHGEIYNYITDPEEKYNLWDDPGFRKEKLELFFKFLWAQLDKESMSMPRIAGA